MRFRDILDYLVEQWLKVGSGDVLFQRSRAVSARAEEDGRIELLVRGVQIHQKLVAFVYDLIDSCVWAVYLVYNYYYPVTKLQGVLQNESCLRHRTFCSVNKQDNAVNHLQNSFNLAAEISMAGGVYNIYLDVVIHNRGVLGKNCNASFTLDVVRVHDPFADSLIGSECAALTEHTINKSGLSVVNMGDYRNVS